MKNLINLVFVSLITLVISTNALSQNIDKGELMLVNSTGSNGYTISVDIYPVGAIFNGNYQYTFKALYPIDDQNNNKIFGIHQEVLSNNTSQHWYVVGNFDKTYERQGCSYSFGYGKYRVDIYDATYTNKLYTFDVDFSDANFTGVSTADYYQQIRLDYYSSSDVKFKFYGSGTTEESISNGGTIYVWEQRGTPNSAKTPSKGDFKDFSENGTEYHRYPLNAGQYGFKHISPEQVNMNLNLFNYDLLSSDPLYFYNSTFKVSPGRTFNYASLIVISGKESKFVSENSTIIFKNQGSIEVGGGGSVQASGTTFTSTGTSVNWKGIKMENPNYCNIDNCIFENSAMCITINNDMSYTITMPIIITNNVFEQENLILTEYSYGVGIYNCINVTIMNNSFHLFPKALCSYGTYVNFNPIQIAAPYWYTVKITGNDFHNGFNQVKVFSVLDIISVNITDNYFYNGQVNISLLQTKGNISRNNFEYSSQHPNLTPIWLINSKTNLLNNNIASLNHNIIARESYPNLAPLHYGGEYIWTGGNNVLNSTQGININSDQISLPSYYQTDHGKNHFNTTGENYNLYGYFVDSTKIYYTNGNCWNNGTPGTPKIFLQKTDGTEIPYIWNEPPDCNWNEGSVSDRILTDNGNGTFDTILITQSNEPPANTDETWYATGVKNELTESYSTAIMDLKSLIDTYPESKNLERSIFDLYDCYVKSDTNGTQAWRTYLFTELKNYLESKIQMYDSNSSFVGVAFDFYLISKVKIKEYQSAMEGYQYIAENNPSALKRLIASIAYLEVEGLLQGSGGSQRDVEGNIGQKQNKNGGPLKDILSKIYKKMEKSVKQNEKIELQNSNNYNKTITAQISRHNEERILNDKAMENIRVSSGLSKQERKDMIQESLTLLSPKNDISKIQINKVTNAQPQKFELSQNYPNPFNPVTKITFSIEKMAITSLKVYDVLGREVKMLVNEIKQPGTYSIDFDGSMLSSGVYFYRLESGNYTDVKRMMLVK